jgi:hypothetical protein
MARDFNRSEDLQPGISFKAEQPERTGRGKVWTQRVVFDYPAPGWTWMTIRDCDGDILIDHGRVWPIDNEQEDSA